MKIFVQTLEGVKYKLDDVELDQPVDVLKLKIKAVTGVNPAEQTLIYLGQSMESGTLEQFGLLDGCTVNLVHRSVGGGSSKFEPEAEPEERQSCLLL